MSVEKRVDEVITDLRVTLRSKVKRRFLRDLHGQLLEGDAIMSALSDARYDPRPLMVTFDRRRRRPFAYGKFDMVLEVLDAMAGGSGVLRPVSQLRVLRWRGTRRGLRLILRAVARSNRDLRFRRLLIMRYQAPEVGYRLYGG